MNDRSGCQQRRTVQWAVVACVAAILAARSASAQESRPIVLNHADTLLGKIIDGEQVQVLFGHVQLQQGNVHITCDTALQFRTSGNVNLTGNVVVYDDSVTLTSPRGRYDRATRRAEGFGGVHLDDGKVQLTARYGWYLVEPRIAHFRDRVVVQDSSSTITADSLTYYRNTRRSEAFGKVTIVNQPDNVTITGGRLQHDASADYSRVTVHPLLLQIDTTSDGTFDTLFVKSRVMESYRGESRRLVATDSVEILRGELAAIAQLVQFFTRGDSILLRQSPVVWYQRTQVSGDSINVYLKNRKLSRVQVMQSALAISESDSLHPGRLDQITGDQMLLTFENQRLHLIDVQTRAISLYHLYDDTVSNGLNRTSGDRILMRFADGKLSTITVVGGVEGDYYPENMVRGREREYRLPGFSWRVDRPTQQRFAPVARSGVPAGQPLSREGSDY